MSSRLSDDTALDAIAAQVHEVVPLDAAEVGALLDEVRTAPAGPATGRLVEHQLGTVLDAVLRRRGSGLDPLDLYQEGSIAATVAVREYASRGGAAAGMRAYVGRVVDTFLEDVIKRADALRLEDTMLVERVQLLETAEVLLRGRLEREPTILEFAAALEWTPEEVEVVSAVLTQARQAYDSEIVEFLDNIDDDDGGGTTDT